MVYQKLAMDLKATEIAANLNVSTRTVHRILLRFIQTGSVAPSKRRGRQNFCYTEEEEILIIGLIYEKPSMYLDEIVSEIDGLLGLQVWLVHVVCAIFSQGCMKLIVMLQMAALTNNIIMLISSKLFPPPPAYP